VSPDSPNSPNPPNPVVLAIDTSALPSSVALCGADTVLGRAQFGTDECRGEALGSLVDGLLEAGFIEVSELAGIAVVVGPGSYTGLRIGLALARGLALVDGLELVPFGSLELLAMAASGDTPPARLTLISAGRDKLYAAAYRVEGATAAVLREPEPVELAELEAFIGQPEFADVRLCVEAETAELLPVGLRGKATIVEPARAAVAGHAAIARLADGMGVSAEMALPAYVGGSNARPNRNRVVRNDAVVK
jgi:tRNA threonylcarbamoyladenosine biosynthesis protein TsaB